MDSEAQDLAKDLVERKTRIRELAEENERLRKVMENAAHQVMNGFPPTRARERTSRMLRNALDGAEADHD